MKRRPSSSNYQFRKRVPDLLRPIIQMLEITRTLESTNKYDAKTFKDQIGVAVSALFAEAKRINLSNAPIPPKGWAKAWLEDRLSGAGYPPPLNPIIHDPEERAAPLQGKSIDFWVSPSPGIFTSGRAYAASTNGLLDQILDKVSKPTTTTNQTTERGLTPISQVMSEYFTVSRLPSDTEDYWCKSMDMLFDVNQLTSATPIATISDEHISKFILALHKVPANRQSPKLQAMTVPQLVAQFGDNQDVAKLSIKSIKKRIDAVRAILGYATTQRYILHNPAANKIQKQSKRTTSVSRRSWEIDELQTLFTSVWFKIERNEWGGKQWLPIIAAYHGARMEEIAQLLVSDYKDRGGIQYVRIMTMAGEEEDKSVKTESSKRELPLHPIMFALGFDEYVNGIIKSGNTRIFPDINSTRRQLSAAYSTAFGRYCDKISLVDSTINFHTLRDTFIDQCRHAKIQKDIRQAIVGHASEDVHDTYGNRGLLEILTDNLRCVRYGLEWESKLPPI